MGHDFSAGEVVSTQQEVPHRLPTAPRFVLFHDPDAWRAEKVAPAVLNKKGEETKPAEYRWLPMLKQLPIAPGVNGVRQGRKVGNTISAPDPTPAIVRLQRQGFTIIPEDFDGGFMVRHRVDGGWRYCLKFEKLRRHGRISEVEFDRADYNRFRAKLVEDGIIRPIRPGRIKELQRRAESMRSGADEAKNNRDRRIARTQAVVEAVGAANGTW